MHNFVDSMGTVLEHYHLSNNLYSITIELLSHCNWDCLYCYFPERVDILPYNIVIEVLNDARKLGAYEVVFTGGEIFTRDDIFLIIEYARNLGFSVVLMTNISLLSDETIKKLSELSISSVSCSLFSIDSHIHNTITQRKGSHEAVMRNLTLLRASGINTIVKMTVLKLNYKEISALQSFCINNGYIFKVDVAVFSKLDGNRHPHTLSLSNDELDSVIEECDNINGYEYYPERDRLEAFVCGQMRIALSINPKGDINPCNRMPFALGNVFSDSICDVWKKSQMLKKFTNAKYKDCTKCTSCSCIKFCVRCPGNAFVEDDGYDNCSTLSEKIAKSRIRVYGNK